jgi:hypothetical protein
VGKRKGQPRDPGTTNGGAASVGRPMLPRIALRDASSKAFYELQQDWYAILAATGFRDIEKCTISGWTFPGGNEHSRATVHRQLPTGAGVELKRLADHPTAEYWQQVGRAANDLPADCPHRDFILAVSESGILLDGGGNGGYRGNPMFGLSRRRARTIWAAFLQRAGLPSERDDRS